MRGMHTKGCHHFAIIIIQCDPHRRWKERYLGLGEVLLPPHGVSEAALEVEVVGEGMDSTVDDHTGEEEGHVGPTQPYTH
jgi:hypothetical protein